MAEAATEAEGSSTAVARQPVAPTTSSTGRPHPKAQAPSPDESIDASVARRLTDLDLNSIVTGEVRARETAMEERIIGVVKDMLATSLRTQLAANVPMSTVAGPQVTQGPPGQQAGAIVPARSKINERNLVPELNAMVMADLPNRTDFGYHDVVIRDIVSAVVKDLAGVMEAMLDRLLREKKQDTIRAMVAELVTDDIAKTVSYSKELLLRQELGHLVQHLEQLGKQVQQSEADWTERFTVTKELRRSQEDLWNTITERHQALEERVKSLESSSATTEALKKQAQELSKRMDEKYHKVEELAKQNDAMEPRLKGLEANVQETTTLQERLTTVEESLSSQLTAVDQKLTSAVEEQKQYAAGKADVEKLRTEHEARFSELQQGLATSGQNLESAQAALTKMQESSEDTFATKLALTTEIEAVLQKVTSGHDAHKEMLKKLEVTKATYVALDDARAASKESWEASQAKAAEAQTELEKVVADLAAFQTKCGESFATHKTIEELLKTASDRLRQEFNSQQEVAMLQASINAEKERVSENIQLQNSARDDLNKTMEEVYKLRATHTELQQLAEQLRTTLSGLDEREKEHWEKEQATSTLQMQSQKDLEVLYQKLKDDFNAYQEFQNAEGNKLRQHATQRYFEQMDKALQLQQSVEKVDKDNTELHESVRSIRLPPVV